jgi:hypothetical protein
MRRPVLPAAATVLACWWREWVHRNFDDVVARNNGYRQAGMA